MTIKVTITHDEPSSDRNIKVGMLHDMPGYQHPQFKETRDVKPGETIAVYIYEGVQIQVWEAPLKVELEVADEIERAMDQTKNIPAPKLDPRVRNRVARAAIAAARRG